MTKEYGSLRQSVLDEIGRKPQTIKEIQENLSEAPRASVNAAVYALHNKGLIKRTNAVKPAKWERTHVTETEAGQRASYLSREDLEAVLKRVEMLESTVQTQGELIRVLSKDLQNLRQECVAFAMETGRR